MRELDNDDRKLISEYVKNEKNKISKASAFDYEQLLTINRNSIKVYKDRICVTIDDFINKDMNLDDKDEAFYNGYMEYKKQYSEIFTEYKEFICLHFANMAQILSEFINSLITVQGIIPMNYKEAELLKDFYYLLTNYPFGFLDLYLMFGSEDGKYFEGYSSLLSTNSDINNYKGVIHIWLKEIEGRHIQDAYYMRKKLISHLKSFYDNHNSE